MGIEKTRSIGPVIGDIFVIAITIAAVGLGGATNLWSQACIITLAAFAFLFDPPTRVLPRFLNVVFVGLALLGLTGFLPASVFPEIPNRSQLVQDYNISLASTLSAQPWHTFESVCLFYFGLAWAYYLLTRHWTLSRRRQLEIFSCGMLLLILYAFGVVNGWPKPGFWPDDVRFGFFPNRNQTANVTALSGVIMLALALDGFATRKKVSLLWAAGFFIACAAVVFIGSRAGVLLLFGAALALLLWIALAFRDKSHVGLGVSLLLLSSALFLLVGGDSLERLSKLADVENTVKGDLRIILYKDTVGLSRQVPLTGVGLGNFESIFAMHRSPAGTDSRAKHPESDWLWMAAELGWLAPALVLAGLAFLWKGCLPIKGRPDRFLRTAAVVCTIFFALHGLVDVPGHRMGSVMPALFLMAIAQDREWNAARGRPVAMLYRAFAVILLAMGAIWLPALGGRHYLPSSITTASHKRQIQEAFKVNDHAKVAELATAALQWSPLDFQLYFQRGAALAFMDAPASLSLIDFKRARFLEPQSRELPFNEGKIWLARDEPLLVVNAWQEALRRLEGAQANALCAEMYHLSKTNSQIWLNMLERCRPRIPLWFVFLSGAHGSLFQRELNLKLAEDPELETFSDAEKQRLFDFWRQRGDRDRLIQLLQKKPHWLKAGWELLADHHAESRDFKKASDLVLQHSSKPLLPSLAEPRSVQDLKREFIRKPKDFVTGYALVKGQINNGEMDDALATLSKLTVWPDCPRYFLYMEMQLLAQKGASKEAWDVWKRYKNRT